MPLMPHRIFRRPFNPADEESKSSRVLVAKFSHRCKAEADAMLKFLQDRSTAFEKNEWSNYRYTMTTDSDPIKPKLADLQIDTSTAKRTGRPIKYQLTWDNKADGSHMIAYHERYGSIRAVVENDPIARQHFVRAIKRVWPNAELTKK